MSDGQVRHRIIKALSVFVVLTMTLSNSGCVALAVGGAVVSATSTVVGAGVAVGSAAIDVTTGAVKAVIP